MVDEHKVRMREIPDYGDLMTVEAFAGRVASHFFTNNDGSGYFATSSLMSDVEVDCNVSSLAKNMRPKWATHVVWFNK
jgi:hypothetical protein